MRYEDVFPAHMIESFQRAAADTELLEQTAEIAAITVRIEQLFTRLSSGNDSSDLWVLLQSNFHSFEDAAALARQTTDERERQKYTDTANEAMGEIRRLIRHGAADVKVWKELTDLFQQKKALVESQRKRELELGNYLELPKVLNFARYLIDSVRRHIFSKASDREKYMRIEDDFRFALQGMEQPLLSANPENTDAA